MLNVLYKYLVLNGNVSIPGVGSFAVKRSAAKFINPSFHPYTKEILFEAGTALTDKNFYHFLAHEKGISEVDAVRKFQDFAYQLRKDLQSNSYLELSGIGILKRNAGGEVVMDEGISTRNYFPVLTPEIGIAKDVAEQSFGTEQTTIDTKEEDTIKRDRWWIWATVLALLALAAIGLFYWQENI